MRYCAVFLSLLLLSGGLQAKSRVDIAEENADCIVAINVLKKDGTTFTGTGFVVTPDGVIATSRHVIDYALYMNVTFNTGAVSGEAKPLARTKSVDLALIKIDAQNLHTVTLADSEYVLPGQEITVIGNPRRLQNSVTSGLISQVRKKADGVIWHQISAPISPSSSGSPVFNEQGYVISIAFSSYEGEGNQNLNFAVPSNYLIQLMRNKNLDPLLADTEKEDNAAHLSGWARFKAHCKQSWDVIVRFFRHNR